MLSLYSICHLHSSIVALISAQVSLYLGRVSLYDDILTGICFYLCLWSSIVCWQYTKATDVLMHGLKKFRKHLKNGEVINTASSEKDNQFIIHQISIFLSRLALLRKYFLAVIIITVCAATVLLTVYLCLNRNIPYRYAVFFFLVGLFPISSHIGVVIFTTKSEASNDEEKRIPSIYTSDSGNKRNESIQVIVVPKPANNNLSSIRSQNYRGAKQHVLSLPTRLKSNNMQVMIEAAPYDQQNPSTLNRMSRERMTVSVTEITQNNNNSIFDVSHEYSNHGQTVNDMNES